LEGRLAELGMDPTLNPPGSQKIQLHVDEKDFNLDA
jgi:hypothetical protein